MQASDWFVNARYGMIIHHGLYSLLERGEWVLNREQIALDEYRALASRFTADKFDAGAICDLAVRAGMRYVTFTTMHTGGLGFASDNWRFKKAENPGGSLFQCGIHKIDTLRFLFGEGKWLAGYVNRTVTASPTDDAYVLLGTFGNVPCTFHSHYVCSYRHAMEIYGTKGDLFITEFPDKLEHKITDLTSGFEPVHDITAKIPPSDAELESLRDFAQAVRERRQPKMNGREGLQALELVFEAERISTEIK